MTTGPIVRGALVALTVVTLPASRAEAFCHLFKGWFGAPATTTYYAPYTASYAPAGCGQTVNYVAQTSYRTVYVNAPVTTMRPMPAVDGCTGCPTTVMRPVVSYVPQAQLVPYTTYRPVVTAAAPCCGAVATAAYYTPAVAAPAAVYAPAPAAPAPCCGGGAAAMVAPMGAPGATVPSLAAPTLNYPSAAPLTTAPPSASAYPGAAPTPLRLLALCRKARPAVRPRCNRHPIRTFRLRSLRKTRHSTSLQTAISPRRTASQCPSRDCCCRRRLNRPARTRIARCGAWIPRIKIASPPCRCGRFMP